MIVGVVGRRRVKAEPALETLIAWHLRRMNVLVVLQQLITMQKLSTTLFAPVRLPARLLKVRVVGVHVPERSITHLTLRRCRLDLYRWIKDQTVGGLTVLKPLGLIIKE